MQPGLAPDLRRRLVDAPDLQLSQVVALLDAMPSRGAADALIEPLRARLAAIAPARQLSLPRLLFKPLDPVILPASRWRPGMPAIPRTALGPIAAACLARLDDISPIVRSTIAGRSSTEAAAIKAGGAVLWPAAGHILETLPLPVDWSCTTGLPETEFAPIRAGLATVLNHAWALETCRTMAQGPELAVSLRAILSAADARGPLAGLLMAVMLADSALAAAAMVAGAGLAAPLVEAAAQLTLGHADYVVGTLLPTLGLAAAAAQAAKVGALLVAMDTATGPPGLRGTVQRLRQAAEAACQTKLAQALSQDLIPRLKQAGPELPDCEMQALEGVARNMRRLATAGRHFGGGTAADRLLDTAVTEIEAEASNALSSMDRLRLVELLNGSAAALQAAGRLV